MKRIKIFVLLAVLLIVSTFSGCVCKHEWKAATCDSPSVCTKCGETQGNALGHTWKASTCTSPKTCSRCGKTEGSAQGHSWKSATCTEAKTCSKCGKTEGSALGHNLEEFVCKRCKAVVVTKKDVPNLIDITKFYYHVNSVGGIELKFNLKNKSQTRTIKYFRVKIEFYNRVGDVIKNDVGGQTVASLEYTGPLKPGKTDSLEVTAFYNQNFGGTMNFKSVEIVYTDGTVITLADSIADEVVVGWR